MTALEKYNYFKDTPSDINEHLPTLKKYGEECSTIIELGTGRTVSTWAFVISKPSKFTTVDVVHPDERGLSLSEIEEACIFQGTEFKFINKSSLEISLPDHDLLFIDTKHNYDVLKQELQLHTDKTKKYIIFHDTVSFGYRDEFGQGPGLCLAIKEFLENNPQWQIKEHNTNNNGLMILSKK